MNGRRKIIETKDGSHTIAIPEMNVTYHSLYGAVQESRHVFINAGLNDFLNRSSTESLNILEMGFGTGLNAFLTALQAEEKKVHIHYTAIEQFPLTPGDAKHLNYVTPLGNEELFYALHQSNWNEPVKISKYFTLHKIERDLLTLTLNINVNLIYYDAFAPSAQPELWSTDVFVKMFDLLLPGGVLVTYCSKGDVRRAMKAAGFAVEKLPGPPGKREMLRATKS